MLTPCALEAFSHVTPACERYVRRTKGSVMELKKVMKDLPRTLLGRTVRWNITRLLRRPGHGKELIGIARSLDAIVHALVGMHDRMAQTISPTQPLAVIPGIEPALQKDAGDAWYIGKMSGLTEGPFQSSEHMRAFLGQIGNVVHIARSEFRQKDIEFEAYLEGERHGFKSNHKVYWENALWKLGRQETVAVGCVALHIHRCEDDRQRYRAQILAIACLPHHAGIEEHLAASLLRKVPYPYASIRV